MNPARETLSKRSLVIISVPFRRNSKLLLSSGLYEEIKKAYDVLIVSPFGSEENFQKEFGGINVSFFDCPMSSAGLRHPFNLLFDISEKMRFNGYWFRFRQGRMRYFWELVKTGRDDPGKKSRKARCFGILLGYSGYFRGAWRLFDRLFSSRFYDLDPLKRHLQNYADAIMVQTGNWGYQERFLSRASSKLALKNVLVPYTTDQLSINGYLISDFHRICTQGPVESAYAFDYHQVDRKKIVKLGMIWLRNLESLADAGKTGRKCLGSRERTILYAGVSSLYFGRRHELEAVDRIISDIETGILPDAKLIYRPVIGNADELREIEWKYKDKDLLEIQLPQQSMIGMFQSGQTVSVKSEIADYMSSICGIDLFVMSCTTSMLLDAMFLKIPVIANFYDATEPVREGLNRLLLKDDPFELVASGMRVVRSTEEMMTAVHAALDDPESYREAQQQVLNQWDYPDVEYVGEFMHLLRELAT